jgi:hypothetical protein
MKTKLKFLIFIFSLALNSCSDAKLVQHHLKKAEKHGGKIVCDTTYIDVPKIVKGRDGKDSLIYVETAIPCKPCQPCETKREIKWKYKYDLKQQKLRDAFIIDSMNKVLTNDIKHAQIKRKSDKNASKQNTKTETANNKTVNIGFIVFGIVGSLVLLLLLLYKFKR